MTRKEYYVQSTKYQFFKLIRETPQLDLDRCLTSSVSGAICGLFQVQNHRGIQCSVEHKELLCLSIR